jgi:hypothetical protein
MTTEMREDSVLQVSDLVMDFPVGGRLIGRKERLRGVFGVSLSIGLG